MQSSYIIISLFIVSTITYCHAADNSAKWNYVRADTSYGPSVWKKNAHFSECSGDRNSPIDIDKTKIQGREAEKWELNGWDKEANWTVTDHAYTIKFSLDSGFTMKTNGGKMGSAYKVLQFHFHWGKDNKYGSEHTVDGKSYPMEVHFVHQKDSFPNLTSAVQSEDSDALAAVGFFFRLQREDNPKLAKLVDAVKMVRQNSTIPLPSYPLDSIQHTFRDSMEGNYFRYFGGLTTPGCQQIVRWTVFERPIDISEAQMAVFRNHSATEYGTEFYREVQPLGRRTVTLYDVDYDPSKYGGGAAAMTALGSLSILSVIVSFI